MIAALALTLSLTSAPVVPDDSLYLLDASFVDQAGRKTQLDAHSGAPVLLAMFYATCPSACPRLIADVKRALDLLDEEDRKKVRVILVSLDPERDTPAVLAKVIEARGLDAARTTLMAGSAEDTRRLAALLGVKYREDGKGAIDHSSRIVVLDRQGKIAGKRDGLGGSVTDTAETLKLVLSSRK